MLESGPKDHSRAKLTKAALRYYQGDKAHFFQLLQSEYREHTYVRSFACGLSICHSTELHFDKRFF